MDSTREIHRRSITKNPALNRQDLHNLTKDKRNKSITLYNKLNPITTIPLEGVHSCIELICMKASSQKQSDIPARTATGSMPILRARSERAPSLPWYWHITCLAGMNGTAK